jgi:hypothetical protein
VRCTPRRRACRATRRRAGRCRARRPFQG